MPSALHDDIPRFLPVAVSSVPHPEATRALFAGFNPYRGPGRVLVDAAGIRRQERLIGQLTEPPYDAPRAAAS